MKIKSISALLLFSPLQVVCSNENDLLSVLSSDTIEQKVLAARKKKRELKVVSNVTVDAPRLESYTESDEILYEKLISVPIKHIGNTIMIQSDEIFGLLKDGYTKNGQCGKKIDAVTMATSALLSVYDDVFDFVYVLPYYNINHEKNNYDGCTSQTNIGNNVPFRKSGGALRSMISTAPYPPGYYIASLHELGHAWLVYLDSLPQQKAEIDGVSSIHSAHWGFTTLDKHGMLGGFAPDVFVCKKPDGRIPTKSLPCDNNELKNFPYFGKKGSPTTSHDLIGPFAKVELMIMGLMSQEEISDEEIVHCKNLKAELNSDRILENVSCEEIVHLSAKDISDSLSTDQRSKQIEKGAKLRAAHVIVFDTKYELPKDESELNDVKWKEYLEWANGYGPELEDLFFENTYKNAELTFSVSDNDLGCGLRDKNLCRKSPNKSKKGKGECGDLIPILEKDCPKKSKIKKLKRCLKAKYGELCKGKETDKCETDKKLNNCSKNKDIYEKRAPTE